MPKTVTLLKESAVTQIITDLENAVEADRLLAQQARVGAELAETNSETAQGLSETAQGLSEAARDKSQQWAENPEDIEVETGEYSSKHWATKAGDAYAELPNAEHAIADIIAHLEGRIKTLEELLVASKYNTIQVKELSVVENVKLKGADTKLYGTGAPIITPDFAGQEYLDQAAKIWYDAVGIVNAGDWKPRTNA